MTLAERIFWFKRDICHKTVSVAQIEVQIGTIAFLNEMADYLLTIVLECQHSIKQIGEPDGSYEQMLLDDHIELHNRAVDLYNDLMDRGVDIVVA